MHYYTTPGYTWDAMLKYTKMTLQLHDDIDMVLFIEKGIRGGISQCSNRYAKANNKYMKPENIRSKEDIHYMMYYDINSLYGWGMSHSLPYGHFEWVKEEDLNTTDYNVGDDFPVSYILEVDLEYPKEQHDQHKDLPFCPKRAKPPGCRQKKLLTTLHDKKNYVIHYKYLKYALDNGLKLKKIHRVLKFNQLPWLKSYIELNTRLRAKAKTEFEKNVYKLLNNAIYGIYYCNLN